MSGGRSLGWITSSNKLQRRYPAANSSSDHTIDSTGQWASETNQSTPMSTLSSEITGCQDCTEQRGSAESWVEPIKTQARDMESICAMPAGWIETGVLNHTGCILTVPAHTGSSDAVREQHALQLGAVSEIHGLQQHWRSYVLLPSGKHTIWPSANDSFHSNTNTTQNGNSSSSEWVLPNLPGIMIPNSQVERSVAS